MRYLIVAHLTADSPELLTWLEDARARDRTFAFVLLVPTAPRSYWRAWNVLDDQHAAEARAARARALFASAGIAAERIVIGSREPLAAIEDELRADPNFETIVIVTLPVGLSRWLRLDIPHQCQRRTGLPTVHLVASTQADDSLRTMPGVSAAPSLGPSPGVVHAANGPPANGIAGSMESQPAARYEADPGAEERAMSVAPTRLARTLQLTPPLADAFWSMASLLESQSGLDPMMVETVALSVACRLRFTELWQEHVRIARALGMPDLRIAAIEHWHSSEHVRFSDRERAVLAYTAAVCQEAGAVVETRDFLERFFGQAQIAALTLMIGFYRMAGSFAHALSLGVDEPFVGWSLFRGEATPHL